MKIRWLARYLLPRMRAYAEAREPNLRIKDGPEKKDYLRRWHILRRGARWRPSLYLHNMLGPDKATLHDHPYWSVSLVLSDGIIERYCRDPRKGLDKIETRTIRQGEIVFRSSRFSHQLLLTPGSDPWTLFFTGRRLKKDWGFWCPQGWRHWAAFQKNKVYDKMTYGSADVGCGEIE